jgi:hypothetical protein
MSFKKINNIAGWLIFLLATFVYVSTMEQTASFWDCGEFIAVSYKLMVPHPPGAPFFLLVGRLFSMLAGDVTQVAYWINMLSALSSSFTILFLFWTISLTIRRFILPKNETSEYTLGQTISIIGGAIVGSLAYTFSDSFWFSATEAEVYAMSSFFTALIVWAMLKWEVAETESSANRWLLFIAYMMGLSIGVHLLNLLAIPALGLIYYFKKNESPTRNGILLTLGISGFIVMFITYGIIPGLPTLAGAFEVFFVNTLGLPFASGAMFLVMLLVGGIVYGIRYSIKNKNLVLNLSLLSLVFILIGYSSYAMILIRSNYDTPINENTPDDVMRFVSYLKREQYGSRPLIYGQSFNAQRESVEDGEALYRKGKDKYEVYDHKVEVSYASRDKMLFPRIYSSSESHKRLYREKLGLAEGQKPTFSDNVDFFLSHQLGHMYFRYFMWNFAGRESDEKDAAWLMPTATSDIPLELQQNKTYNNFYMLPLLLGILGLVFQSYRDPKGWASTGMLFFMLGIAIVLYINSPPIEPRERDYVYVGSFYAFCIWIGIGAVAITEWLKKIIGDSGSAILGVLVSLSVPFIMASKGWDNHDRSNRYLSIDQARNTLASCEPNAILFSGGDNDTFPLWYVQEVEGFRTDVRVAVLSYFNTDWYIDQMKRKVDKSEGMPISFTKAQYIQGKNDFIPIVPREEVSKGMYLRPFLNAVKNNDPRIQVALQGGTSTASLPSSLLILKIDSAAIASRDFIPENKKHRVVNQMVIKAKSTLMKGDLMILDMLANSDWKRPIYFNSTSAHAINLDLNDYLQMEGMTYRVMPIKTENSGEVGEVNTEQMLKHLETFEFRGMQDSTVYYDDEYRKFTSNFRNVYWRLAFQLMREQKQEEALKVLRTSIEKLPNSSVPFSFYMPRYVDLFHLLKDDKTAKDIADILLANTLSNLDFVSNNGGNTSARYDLVSRSLYILRDLNRFYRTSEQRADKRIKQLEYAKLTSETTEGDAEIEELKRRQVYFTEYALKLDELLEQKMSEFYPSSSRQ